jgi:hypothetical protein
MQGVGQIPTRPGGADQATWLDRMFRLSANGTTARGEVAAGTTTFMVMA